MTNDSTNIDSTATDQMRGHEQYMRLAIDQANCGVGLTAPNPPVWAVVVKDGNLIGSGFHP